MRPLATMYLLLSSIMTHLKARRVLTHTSTCTRRLKHGVTYTENTHENRKLFAMRTS